MWVVFVCVETCTIQIWLRRNSYQILSSHDSVSHPAPTFINAFFMYERDFSSLVEKFIRPLCGRWYKKREREQKVIKRRMGEEEKVIKYFHFSPQHINFFAEHLRYFFGGALNYLQLIDHTIYTHCVKKKTSANSNSMNVEKKIEFGRNFQAQNN